jgi:hypothetical protein
MELDNKPLYSAKIQMKTQELIQPNRAHVTTRTPASPSCQSFPGLPSRHAGKGKGTGKGKGKGKVHPITGHEGPKGE